MVTLLRVPSQVHERRHAAQSRVPYGGYVGEWHSLGGSPGQPVRGFQPVPQRHPSNPRTSIEGVPVRTNPLLATAFAAALFTSFAGPAIGEDPTPLRIEAQGETVTIIARDVPLKDVLDQLQQQAGFALVENTSSLQRPVTITLEAVPWREGLAKLLCGFRYALAMDPQTNQPDRLVILSSEETGIPEPSGDGELGFSFT